VEVTVCTKATGGHSGTPCVGRTYAYDPYVKMKVVLGPSAGSIARYCGSRFCLL